MGGYLVSVSDTAGLRGADDAIEAEGIRRAKITAQAADLKLLVFDAGAWPELDAQTLEWRDPAALCVLNKIDLLPKTLDILDSYIPVSVKTGEGADRVLQRIQEAVAERLGGSETPGLTRERHRRELGLCVENLDRALNQKQKPAELIAEDVRLAMRALGRITGRADVEDMLDVLFGEFCIGK